MDLNVIANQGGLDQSVLQTLMIALPIPAGMEERVRIDWMDLNVIANQGGLE